VPTQLELFSDQPASVQVTTCAISGLRYQPSVWSLDEQDTLIESVDKQPWLNDLKRRVQHYGYKYDYRARRIDHTMFVGPLPQFALEVAQRLVDQRLLEELPDQMIVNEYLPGQGISAHVDCEPCFTSTIATVSLGSQCEMDFVSRNTGEKKSLILQPGSVLVLTGEARYDWTHAIPFRKSDRGVPRQRRVSLTFRKVILQLCQDGDDTACQTSVARLKNRDDC